MTKVSATALGFVAVLMWAFLALLTEASGNVPPFLLVALTFAIGGCIGVVRWIARPVRMKALKQPASVWFLGVVGLFGYHFAYFTALRSAPAVEVSLIAYLWPLLIVLFSSFLPGEHLRSYHLAGAVFGLFGATLIVMKDGSLEFQRQYAFGYAMALMSALIWSGYSILSRRLAKISTDVVTGFCFATSVLAALAHVFLEQTIWPSALVEWIAVILLGLGPVGLAFYVWDCGVKQGDIQVLGAMSYFAPLLSTLLLILFGFAQLTWSVAFACILITAGGVIAAQKLFLGCD